MLTYTSYGVILVGGYVKKR